MSDIGSKGQVPCCGGPVSYSSDDSASSLSDGLFPEWVADTLKTSVGTVPVVKTEWSREDHRGRRLARWTRKRMSYTVPPGLYAVGSPD
ncbi:MAG: hypothetical protein MUP70_09990, partial [Candidatus Aminicenantes bacterium]|nr:hypothetical protein [Candidatus Aminicenantes bacterium]